MFLGRDSSLLANEGARRAGVWLKRTRVGRARVTGRAMAKEAPEAQRFRDKVETRALGNDDCLLMVDPDNDTRLACVEAAVDCGCRPVVAKRETAAQVAAENRPLVIVVADGGRLGGVALTDLVVGVGAQLVRTTKSDAPGALAERVRLAITAARRIRPRAV